MKPFSLASIVVLVPAFFLLGQLRASAEGAALVSPAADPGCAATLASLTNDPDWWDELVNPIVQSREQLPERTQFYMQVRDCLLADPGSLPGSAADVYRWSEYFLVFAVGAETPSGQSQGLAIPLDTMDDPAVKRLRDELGVPPPPGLVLVRIYSSVDAMPPIVRRSFADKPGVVGATFYARYVAVLGDLRAQYGGYITKTLSHELVHAYLNSAAGARNMDAFPPWYREGMAVYFSDSSDPSCTIGDASGENCQTPEDYRQYTDNFNYLDATLGHPRFLQVLKQSFDQVDASLLYSSVGLASEEELVAAAHAWKQQQDLKWGLIIFGTFAGPLLIVWLIYIWRSTRPVVVEREPVPAYSGLPSASLSLPAASPSQLLEQPPLHLDSMEWSRIQEFWASLPSDWWKLGSQNRVQVVLFFKSNFDRTGAETSYKCTHCNHWAAIYLPADLTPEQYLQVYAHLFPYDDPSMLQRTLTYPYAICLSCGRIYEAYRFGVPRGPRLLNRAGALCGSRPPIPQR